MLAGRLRELLASPSYQPLRQHELAAALRVRRHERPMLRRLLKTWERSGQVVCLRKNRWALPSPTQQCRAMIKGLASGDALALSLEPGSPEFFIARDALAGAIDDDQVLLEPLRRKAGQRDVGERALGRVIRVLPREGRRIAGALARGRGYWYVIPDNHRVLTNVNVTGFAPAFATPPLHHTVVVQLDDWRGPGSALTGTVVEDLGPTEASGVALRSLMRNHGLDERFDEKVEQEAWRHKPDFQEHDRAGREDLRGWITFTIDPEDARDFDDAVSLRRLPDGSWEAGVHIADVAHFVPPGSEVDREARRRGNSVYLVGGFVPMLPPYLTSDICSLRPQVDRLTHSVVLHLDEKGHVLERRTFKSVIHSHARLNYDQVQAFMDRGDTEGIPAPVQAALRDMIPLARAIRQRRMRSGSIDLAMPEVKCELDEHGRATGFHLRGAPEAYHLIEEFMLLANVAVAEIISGKRVPSLYRIHEPPTDEQWEKMGLDLEALGQPSRPANPFEINQLCRQVADSPAAYPVNLAILKNLKRALYSAAQIGHFGLGFPTYTHFTSPIRRYPDLVIHRILSALEANRRSPYTYEDLKALAYHCSVTERSADDAEAESLQEQRIAYYMGEMAAGRTGPYRALVTGLTPRGLLVELQDSLQRGLVPLYVPPRGGRRGARPALPSPYRIGTWVDVELLRVDEVRRLVDFRFTESARPGPEHGTRKAAGKRGRNRRHRMR